MESWVKVLCCKKKYRLQFEFPWWNLGMYIKEMLIPTCLPESLLSGYVDSFDLKCNMGCRVSKEGIQSKIDLGPKINILKGNCCILWIDMVASTKEIEQMLPQSVSTLTHRIQIPPILKLKINKKKSKKKIIKKWTF